MKRETLALFASCLLLLLAVTVPRVATQDAVLMFGAASGVPKALSVTSTGQPNIAIAAGTIPLASGGTGAALVDPNADRLVFWDDSGGAVAFLTAGTGLTITGTTMTAAGGVTSFTDFYPGPSCAEGVGVYPANFESTSQAGLDVNCDTTSTWKGAWTFTDITSSTVVLKTLLPSNWDGSTVATTVYWSVGATSGNVEWHVATVCSTANETLNPSFNTAQDLLDAAPSSNNFLQTATLTPLTMTGCAAGEVLSISYNRNGADTEDTVGGTVYLFGVALTYSLQ